MFLVALPIGALGVYLSIKERQYKLEAAKIGYKMWKAEHPEAQLSFGEFMVVWNRQERLKK